MKKIFIIGAQIQIKNNNEQLFNIYKNAIEKNSKDVQIVLPEDIKIHSDNFQLTTPNASLSDNVKEMARYDLQQILSSDLIVADISRPSTGLGIEICTALSNNKKVLFFANSKSRVSMLLIGYMDKNKINWYKNKKELKIKLNKIFEK